MYRLRHSSKIYSLVDYIVVNLYADIGVSLPPDWRSPCYQNNLFLLLFRIPLIYNYLAPRFDGYLRIFIVYFTYKGALSARQ